MDAHVRVNHLCKVAPLDQDRAVLLLHDERSASAPHEIYQAGFLQPGVVKPERAGLAIPATEIEIDLGEFQRVEHDVVNSPVLSALHSERVEIKAAVPGQQFDFRRASEL